MVSTVRPERSGTFSRNAAATKAGQGERPAGTERPDITEDRGGRAEVPAPTLSKGSMASGPQAEDACRGDSRAADPGPFLPSPPCCAPQFSDAPPFTQGAASGPVTFLRRHFGNRAIPGAGSPVTDCPNWATSKRGCRHPQYLPSDSGVNQGGLRPKHTGAYCRAEVQPCPLTEFF